MTSSKTDYDVIVIGGGIVGGNIALELASDHNVLVLEKGQIAGATSGKATGLVVPAHGWDMAGYGFEPEATQYARDFWADFEGTGDLSLDKRSGVGLWVSDDIEVPEQAAETLQDVGFDVSLLTPDKLDEEFPDVFNLEGITAAIVHENCAMFDPYAATVAIMEEAERRGVDVRTETEVTDMLIENDEVSGVKTINHRQSRGENPTSTIHADDVVCAAGWATREILTDVVEIPVRPYRIQVVNIDSKKSFDDPYPPAWRNDIEFYWRPLPNDELHVVGSPYLVEHPIERTHEVKEEYKQLVETDIQKHLQGIDDATITMEDTCPTGGAGTPDAKPIVDAPNEAPAGLTVATGCSGYGFNISPAIATVVRSLITGEDCRFDPDNFRLDRFDSYSADFTSAGDLL